MCERYRSMIIHLREIECISERLSDYVVKNLSKRTLLSVSICIDFSGVVHANIASEANSRRDRKNDQLSGYALSE